MLLIMSSYSHNIPCHLKLCYILKIIYIFYFNRGWNLKFWNAGIPGEIVYKTHSKNIVLQTCDFSDESTCFQQEITWSILNSLFSRVSDSKYWVTDATKKSLLTQTLPQHKCFTIFVSVSIISIRDHPFSTFAKFSEKLTFLTPWYAQVRLRLRE